MSLLLMLGFVSALAQAELTFEKTSHDFGTFSEDDPVVTTTFKFKNSGDTPLVIHQAIASCGCTVPEYTKERKIRRESRQTAARCKAD